MIYNIYLLLLIITGVPLAALVVYFRWWLEDKHATIYLHANTRQRNSTIQDMYDTELFKIEKMQRITGHLIFVFEILFVTCFLMYTWDYFLGTGGNTYFYYTLLSLFPIYRLFGLLLVYWDYKPLLYKIRATLYYLRNGEFYLNKITRHDTGTKWHMPYDKNYTSLGSFDDRGLHQRQTFASIGAIWESKIFGLKSFVEPTNNKHED